MQPSSLQLHPPALPQASVTLQGLALRYGNQTVLNGLDWQLLPGQVVGLLGRNGAGKTTLLESLLGLRDVQGRIELFGEPVATLGDAARARLGYVPQHSDLFKWMTADEMLAYFRSFYPRWNGDKVDALLQRWAIARDKPIGRLSGGEQQRLAIVRALAHEPDLLVLDEPVASLDPAGRRDFLQELVTQVLARGTTVVFSTHILSDLERVAFNVAFMARGRIALQAPLDELLESTRHISGPAALLDGWARGRDVLHRAPLPDGRLRLLVRGSLQELAACPSAACPSAACPPDACPPGACPPGADVRNVTLDDLFMDLT